MSNHGASPSVVRVHSPPHRHPEHPRKISPRLNQMYTHHVSSTPQGPPPQSPRRPSTKNKKSLRNAKLRTRRALWHSQDRWRVLTAGLEIGNSVPASNPKPRKAPASTNKI